MIAGRSLHGQRASEVFAGQFEDEAGRLVYRYSQRGAPVAVSAAERDAAIADYKRAVDRLSWALLFGMLVGVAGVIAITAGHGRAPSAVAIGIVLAAILIPFFLLHRHAWAAPRRQFDRRPPLGRPRTRREARRASALRTSWRELATSAVTAPVVIGMHALGHDVLHGWGRLWLAGGVLALAAIANRALTKWRAHAALRRRPAALDFGMRETR